MPSIPFVPRQKVKIEKSTFDFVELDCTINETHAFDSVITDHAIEAGGKVTDHAVRAPSQLNLSGIVSNTPFTNTFVSVDPFRAEGAFATLLQYQNDAAVLTVTTKLAVYESMLLKSVRVTRDVDTANIVALDLEFRELRLAGSEFAAVGPPDTDVKSAQKKQKLGKKPTRSVRVSVARGLIKSATGI
jgi:hypothetical protein